MNEMKAAKYDILNLQNRGAITHGMGGALERLFRASSGNQV
ncbi:hypothetical protein ADIS_3131 [Lunatimonas lonarensis]|uniref:Uncharacterized protein n=1 Tax=Lunatimonas lonarensis TaxID=1232681 RepID=R7ZRA7_9BACT|nr:hypothetical protein ADIS_3131 [Lunatimonas lonarensis]